MRKALDVPPTDGISSERSPSSPRWFGKGLPGFSAVAPMTLETAWAEVIMG
jgi:hypothetical protein